MGHDLRAGMGMIVGGVSYVGSRHQPDDATDPYNRNKQENAFSEIRHSFHRSRQGAWIFQITVLKSICGPVDQRAESHSRVVAGVLRVR